VNGLSDSSFDNRGIAWSGDDKLGYPGLFGRACFPLQVTSDRARPQGRNFVKRRLVALVLGLTAALGTVGGVAAVADNTAGNSAPTVVAGSSWT
jgi:hypothetical protein